MLAIVSGSSQVSPFLRRFRRVPSSQTLPRVECPPFSDLALGKAESQRRVLELPIRFQKARKKRSWKCSSPGVEATDP